MTIGAITVQRSSKEAGGSIRKFLNYTRNVLKYLMIFFSVAASHV